MNFDAVEFKSNPDFFFKEWLGLKPNTVRKLDLKDERFQKLSSGRAHFIQIKEVGSNQAFVRRIMNVSFFENWCIISWLHEEVCPACGHTSPLKQCETPGGLPELCMRCLNARN
ncbi:Uncharacterised protein [Candidatus Anstonella stagnisolia]|nr:Uncharacterised protein [Candidatus Anstonella stagnisolia]